MKRSTDSTEHTFLFYILVVITIIIYDLTKIIKDVTRVVAWFNNSIGSLCPSPYYFRCMEDGISCGNWHPSILLCLQSY